MPESDLTDPFVHLANQPDFNPLQLMTELMSGETRFHSVFLAPFSPAFTSARNQYLADGSGPLVMIAEELARQGAPDPTTAARTMLTAAQGMCVVLIALDHGVSSVPQLFFGHLDPAMRAQMVMACGAEFPDAAGLEAALRDLSTRTVPPASGSASPSPIAWPALVAGPAFGDDLSTYWLELAAAVLEGLDEGLAGLGPMAGGGSRERMADLGWWVSQGILHTNNGATVDADDLELLVRCQLLAGEAAAAGQGIDALIRSGGADEESIIELVNAFADGAIRSGQVLPAGQWLASQLPAWNTALGGLYDLPLALLRIQAAAGVAADVLLPTARLLMAANRKAARNDLTKEPLWQVVVSSSESIDQHSDLLDTAAAALFLDRSTSFIVKRLEAKTLPWCTHAGQIRIPARALAAWQAVMLEFKLFD